MRRPFGGRHAGLKRLLLSACLLIAVALGCVAFGWFPQELVRRVVEERLRAAIGPNARIAGLHVVPATLSAEILGLTLEAPGYRLEAPRARARVGFATLLGRSLFLRSFEAESPKILLRPAATGTPSEPFKKRVFIQRLAITSATLRYHDPTLAGDALLEGIDIRGAIGTGVLDISIKGGVWERRKPLPIGASFARLAISPALELDIRSFDVGTISSRLKASGTLGSILDPRPNLSIEAGLDLADGAYVEGLPPMRGFVRGSATVSGKLDALTIQAHAAASELDTAHWRMDRLEADLDHSTGNRVHSRLRLRVEVLDGIVDADLNRDGSALKGHVNLSELKTSCLAKHSEASLQFEAP